MGIKENILKLLKKHSLSEKLLFEFFSDSNEVKNAIEELKEEGLIVQVRKEYHTAESLNLKKGRIVAIKNDYSFASIEGSDKDAFIYNENLNGAFLGDEVYIRGGLTKYYDYEEVVFSIIKRARTKVVGQIKQYHNEWILDVKDIAPKEMTFVINPTSINLLKGSIAIASIEKQNRNVTYVDIIKILGDKKEPGIDVEQIIYKHNADIEFPDKVKEEVSLIPQELTEEDCIGYEDFRDRVIVTIDGSDAKDFDDAVEVKKVDDGFEIGVHIADVSHYVKVGSSLDDEAQNRGTSIYVADRVVPMLPFELSNGICSLNPHVDRLVQSCLFKMDFSGNIISSRITHGVMNSKARLTYSFVNKILKGEEVESTYSKEVLDMIPLLEEAAVILRNKRTVKGALDLETTEIKFVIDENGQPIDVIKRIQGRGEKLIEDLMITANEIVSETIEKMNLPFIYRIHEQPQSKKMETFMGLSNHLGYKTNFSSLTVTSKELSSHMKKIDDEKIKSTLSMMLLRCLAKARYLNENKKHYGLASDSYTHFTSPIRRYPDLLVHRLIDKYLIDKNYDNLDILEKEIAFIAENSSFKERRAMTIEREVQDLEACKFMSNKLGNRYKGFINGMTKNGMFVELDIGIDGFIDFEYIDNDLYIFDERDMTVIGKWSKRVFSLGDKVEVEVVSVDVNTRHISLQLVKDGNRSFEKRTKRKKKKKNTYWY